MFNFRFLIPENVPVWEKVHPKVRLWLLSEGKPFWSVLLMYLRSDKSQRVPEAGGGGAASLIGAQKSLFAGCHFNSL